MASETLKSNIDEIVQLKQSLTEDPQNDLSPASSAATRAEHAADAVLSSIVDVKNAIELLAPSLNATQNSINKMSQTITDSGPSPPNTQPRGPNSYSEADRQILFDPAPGQALFAPEVTPADIAFEMKRAISAAQTEDSPEIQIKATIRLCNGGLIVELTTPEAAKWIRTPENRLKITGTLDTPATIKE
ncbi:hypothetical protein DFH29DRAFT_881326 [Suillus ampliporus]|nr:hypothetical protein DFH29DRAFT_881326 [Suillus ampliporus]